MVDTAAELIVKTFEVMVVYATADALKAQAVVDAKVILIDVNVAMPLTSLVRVKVPYIYVPIVVVIETSTPGTSLSNWSATLTVTDAQVLPAVMVCGWATNVKLPPVAEPTTRLPVVVVSARPAAIALTVMVSAVLYLRALKVANPAVTVAV
ncbi:MAG: hypothetical protein HZA49_05840 [Planctomycetes bacterium]|nr:hypothetical protein [Planctomycetota bacterium]